MKSNKGNIPHLKVFSLKPMVYRDGTRQIWAVLAVLLVFLFPSGTALHAHSGARFYRGNISISTEWEGIIRVTGRVVVKKGVTLTVARGTRVLFNSGDEVEIRVEGRLYIRGTLKEEILFEPADGCKQGNGWRGVEFVKGSGGTVENARLKCSEKGIWGDLSGVRILGVQYEPPKSE